MRPGKAWVLSRTERMDFLPQLLIYVSLLYVLNFVTKRYTLQQYNGRPLGNLFVKRKEKVEKRKKHYLVSDPCLTLKLNRHEFSHVLEGEAASDLSVKRACRNYPELGRLPAQAQPGW